MEEAYLHLLEKVIYNDDDVVTFLHNTHSASVVKKIMTRGFEFQSHLDYTTDVVSAKDPVTIKYFTIVRQAYGNFTVIIQISKAIIEDYAAKIRKKNHHFSEVLSIKPPFMGPEDELVYCLAPHFVKGYIDACNHLFYQNPKFNPSLKLPVFESNLKQILKEKEDNNT
jgi:hypothetical protein